jgi:hypothetical protein
MGDCFCPSIIGFARWRTNDVIYIDEVFGQLVASDVFGRFIEEILVGALRAVS